MATQDQLNSFHRFASEQINSGDSPQSIDELFDRWRYQTLSDDELRENVAAVQSALDDMNNGDRGRDAKIIVSELRESLNIPTTQ